MKTKLGLLGLSWAAGSLPIATEKSSTTKAIDVKEKAILLTSVPFFFDGAQGTIGASWARCHHVCCR
jgi:hypothetical protein